MNKFAHKKQVELNCQQLAIGGLELAAYILHNYEQFSQEDVGRLKQIFNLLSKMLAKMNNSSFMPTTDAQRIDPQITQRMMSILRLQSDADRAGFSNDIDTFKRLCAQFKSEYDRLKYLGIDVIGKHNMDSLENSKRILENRARSLKINISF